MAVNALMIGGGAVLAFLVLGKKKPDSVAESVQLEPGAVREGVLATSAGLRQAEAGPVIPGTTPGFSDPTKGASSIATGMQTGPGPSGATVGAAAGAAAAVAASVVPAPIAGGVATGVSKGIGSAGTAVQTGGMTPAQISRVMKDTMQSIGGIF